jgi:hypothetical protein
MKKKEILQYIIKKQKELGVILILEMENANAINGKIETEIERKDGQKWVVKTQLVKIS